MTRDQHGVNKNLADETYNNPGNIGKRNRRTKAASGLETISSCIRHCKLSWNNSPQKDDSALIPYGKPNAKNWLPVPFLQNKRIDTLEVQNQTKNILKRMTQEMKVGWLGLPGSTSSPFRFWKIIHQVTFLSPAARTSSSNWPKAPSALPLSSKIAPTAPAAENGGNSAKTNAIFDIYLVWYINIYI